MKKRFLLFSLLFVLLMGFVIAQPVENENAGKTQEEIDAEKLQNAVDTYSPLDSEGELNVSYKPFKSKAEERIDKINDWLKANTSWLKAIFGMVPEISWLFAWTIYFILLGILYLLLNGGVTFYYLSEKHPKIIGLGFFVILMVFKVYFWLADKVLTALRSVYEVAWYLSVLIIIGFVLVAAFSPKLLKALQKRVLKAIEDRERERGLLAGNRLVTQVKAMDQASGQG